MSDRSMQPMDAFEVRLSRLMAEGSEPAVRRIDAAALAHEIGRAWPRRGRGSVIRLRLVLAVSLVALALVAAAVAAALLLHHSPPLPLGGAWSTVREVVWSPDGTKLAFFVFDERPVVADPSASISPDPSSVNVQPTKTLYVVSSDGSDLHQVASAVAPGLDWTAPSWSADGRYLTYTGALPADPTAQDQITDLFGVGVDGGTPVDLGAIDDFSYRVSWAPTGHRLLGTLWRDLGMDVVAVDADGSNRRTLTTDHQSNGATWSPDGTRILFTHGIPAANGGDDLITPWIMDADGSNRQQLSMCASLPPVWGSEGLVWSPDGRWFACLDADQAPMWVSLDGRTSRRDPSLVGGFGVRAPGGTRSLIWQDDQKPGLSILIGDGSSTQLTTDPHDTFPVWSPTADSVAFWGIRPGGTGLYAVPARGGPAVLVGPNAVGQPTVAVAWRPAGAGPSRLAYIRDRSIITVNPDGSDPVVVVGTSTVAVERGTPMPADAVVDRVVIDADGPDRAVYRLAPGPDAVITIENRSDDIWRIGLIDDIGPGEQDCRQTAGVSREVASIGLRPPPTQLSTDFVPPVCDIPPHATVRLTDAGFVPRGTLEAVIRDLSVESGHTVLFEFAPSSAP